jgi:hypothetical protein
MPSYELNYYEIIVQPIFINAEGKEFPFEGLTEEDGSLPNIEFKFIINTLRFVFGNDLAIEAETSVKGKMKINKLSTSQMKILRSIREDTCDVPVKYGQSQLRFEIGSHYYDQPPCDQNCDCCECLGCCGYEKN